MNKYNIIVGACIVVAFAFGFMVGRQDVGVPGIVVRSAAPVEWIDLYEDCTLTKALDITAGDSIVVHKIPKPGKVTKIMFCGEEKK